MKQNKYDDEQFFLKYSKMNRSQNGLDGAGEWEELKKLLPNFKNKKILDLGCGYGWHCKYIANQGANHIIGTDISKKMLNVAKSKNFDEKIEYKLCAMEDLAFNKNSFDIIISSLAFHYIKDFEPLIKNINEWLVIGGYLIFSVEHPVFTSYGSQDWIYDEQGNILYFPVDNYYYEGERKTTFLNEQVIKYHRTITTYLNTLLKSNFIIENVVEPKPPKNMLNIPGMKDEMRRPMMLLVKAYKSH